jgi:hypothetical protein
MNQTNGRYKSCVRSRNTSTRPSKAKRTEEANKWTIQVLREKQKLLQATIDDRSKTQEANNWTVQELCEKQNRFQATIDHQRKKDRGSKKRTIQELLEKRK